MRHLPPPYEPPQSPGDLTRRLESLLDADVPAVCPVYVGLALPVPCSPKHAIATHAIAEHLARRDVEELPAFGEIPPRRLRALTAASWGRADAVGSEVDHLPADLATGLWRRIAELCKHSEDLTPLERDTAGTLMLRLGYPEQAARLLGITDVLAGMPAFPGDVRPEHALARAAVSLQLHPRPALVVTQALRAVADPGLSVLTRLTLAGFAMPLAASREAGSGALYETVRLAEQALTRLIDVAPEHRWVERKVLRSLAGTAVLRGEPEAASAYLDRAALGVMGVRPHGRLQRLAWEEEVLALLASQGGTCRSNNDAEGAVTATSRMPGIAPYDPDAWAAHGYALLASGRLDESLHAYEEMLPLGGHPVAAAAFHLGWIHESRGDRRRAQDAYAYSHSVDPTVPAVKERLSSFR
ncbi:tetratricopeptide repeat protein [Streptomyces sp. NPDC006487]|uniref:tetratricopeptide repeat protein n=1 Tax=Streptomyces sp. NPDC006487 TaxID=3364748 RepID=UPI0036A77736